MEHSLNIVNLIEKTPIIRLSNDYQSKLLNKIKEQFIDNEQQVFVASFYCYLNYNSTKDFVINLDDVWKWTGFSRKDPAKVVLKKHFIENVDYKKVVSMMLKNNWIHPNHTEVPGPDGLLSYGGMCFPKDTNALYQLMLKKGTPCEVLGGTISERNKMRL